MDTLTLVLVMMTHRGDFLPQRCLPYCDALPLDYPKRMEVITHYRDRASKECRKDCDDCYWMYREATRLLIRDMPLDNTDASAYLLGRIMGRHLNWQWSPITDSWSWVDERNQKAEVISLPK